MGTTLFGKPLIDTYQLPLRFESALLVHDLDEIERSAEWLDHWGGGYAAPEDWAVIPLLSHSGDHRSNAAPRFRIDHAATPTPALTSSPYLQQVIAAFQTRVLRARLLNLRAGKVLGRHVDYGDQRWSFERGAIRVHVPIRTNPGVKFFVNDEIVPMQPGEAWYVNVCRPHSVENRGDADRVHLVMEMLVNDWLRALFPVETLGGRAFGWAARCIEVPAVRLRERFRDWRAGRSPA